MKTVKTVRWVKTGINRSILMNCLAGNCPFQGPNGHHHKYRGKRFQRIYLILTLSQPDVLTRNYIQRQSSDAVTELVLSCCVYWPNRLGWRYKVLKPPKTFMLLSWWCPLGQGKGHLPARENIRMDLLIPILTPLSFHWTVPLSGQEPSSDDLSSGRKLLINILHS